MVGAFDQVPGDVFPAALEICAQLLGRALARVDVWILIATIAGVVAK